MRRTAAGLAGLGLGRGDASGIMLTNRPEFHWFDAAALHLGATPFSVYNTYTSEQVEYQLQDSGAKHRHHREGLRRPDPRASST